MKNNYLSHLLTIFMVAILGTSCSRKVIVIEQPPEPVPAQEEVHVVYSPGENLTSLTKVHETEYNCDYPFGGDNGRALFFAVHDKAGYSNIYRKDNPTGMSLSQITGGHSHNIAPSYCAVTNMVAFDGQPEGNSVSDIYMSNAQRGGALTQVTNTADYYEQYPCLSRDGKKIVFEKRMRTAGLKSTEIWVKDLQTNENIQLGLGRTPSFSPDGRSIVFVKYSTDGYTTCLCIVNTDGSNLTQLTDAGMGTIWRPCFSPDGRKIVFQCTKQQKGDADLYILDRNGNGLTQLTINKSFDGEPYWANDGNIYFTSDRGGRDKHYQIWRFRYGQGTPPPPPPTDLHIVKQGETITQIAKQYGVTVRDIVQWNRLSSMTLTPGMKLKVSAQ